MAVQLYEHNEKAYISAVNMLAKSGRAAIVHPTGTGKSYIAFRLVEEHPAARVLWLSPSEYIFKTQMESLCGGESTAPQNLTFLTYAKLMLYNDESMAALAPDFIILDEFHRCGAACWGDGVNRLLAAFPHAKLLGLSATSVRYLDGNLDMAEVLFQNHIASEITLGEAIVRGILAAPKYVTTVFRYQKDLARYQKRVENLRSPGLQDASQKLFEALRRALEQAEGMDKVFARHMTEHAGKYIVFCSSVEHMREMRQYAEDWFAGVNPNLHTYAVYSDDPEKSRAFAAFKADNSDALKLLYCINMLNEGIHVKGISGVILLRPTVSPIIYKQQIGRALTAGDTATPLIIDVVNNIEGLCSIDAVQEEMRLAVQRMYREGMDGSIVTERFEVTEQVHDCRVLFEQLQRSLHNTWEQYFFAAKAYFEAHGNLQVPQNYKTENGLSLGDWIVTQRAARNGRKRNVTLTPQQIERLDGIGMVWENRMEASWNRKYAAARQYYAERGNLMVPTRYRTAEGIPLGPWINQLRQWKANGEKQNVLTAERVAMLNEIGMVWNAVSQRWEENYLCALKYYQQNGNLRVPASYKTADGVALGEWIRKLRELRAGKIAGRPLTEQQIKRLDAIGMEWGSPHDALWEAAYNAAKHYYAQHGHLEVDKDYSTVDGIFLGRWLYEQRKKYRAGAKTLTKERIERLNAIGMQWEIRDSWDYRYNLAQQYLQAHGNIPGTYVTEEKVWLGAWFSRQKRIYEGRVANQRLTPEQRQKLEKLVMQPSRN